MLKPALGRQAHGPTGRYGAVMTEPETQGTEPSPQDNCVRLSLCMIVKDEAFFLARCLDTVKEFVDEIILVDTGSGDDTRSICQRYTDQVFDFDWIDDFAAARNYSLQQATGDWILVLDADEVITRDDLSCLRGLLNNTEYDVFSLNQLNYSDDPLERDWQPLTGPHVLSWPYKGFRSNPIVRLFRNRADIHYTGKVHEVIDQAPASVRMYTLDIPIHHDINGNQEKNKEQRQHNYLRIMEDALRKAPDGRLAAQAGAARLNILNDYPGAIAHLQQAVKLGYDTNVNKEAIAEAYYRQGDHERALQAYRELYALGFSSASMCNNFSNLLVKAGELAAAVDVLEKALTLGQQAPERIARLRHNIDYLRGALEQGS